MTLAELLKANGIADDSIEKISAAMKENKIYTAGEENLDVRYGKLKTDHEGMAKRLNDANTLSEELKKSNKDNEDLQSKITSYEQQVQTLQQELEQTKLDAAIKVSLLAEKAIDVDYLTFKLKEKGELAVDEKGEIKGWNDKLAGLKTQFPTQFESSSSKKIEEHKLEGGDDNNTVTKEVFNKMSYQDRVKLFNENPEAYKEMTENN